MQSNKPRFVLIDNTATSQVGHYLEYDRTVIEHLDKSRYDYLMFSNIDFKEAERFNYIPFFYTNFWDRSKTPRPKKLSALQIPQRFIDKELVEETKKHLVEPLIQLKDIFKQDLLNLLREFSVTTEDVLFFPNINTRELVALLEIVEWLQDSIPHLKLTFRKNIFSGPADLMQAIKYPSPEIQLLRFLFDRFEKYRLTGKISFFIDSERLKVEYEMLTSFEFKVLPVPFRHSMIKEKGAQSGPLKIVYLGDARSEKGFQYIPSLIEDMQSYVDNGQVKFVIQTVAGPEPIIHETIAKLKNFSKGVELLTEPLSDQEYYGLLNSANILLIPYDPKAYYSRTSCIFVESVISCTPFVTTAGSWMASVMDPGTGECVEDPEDLSDAAVCIVENYDKYVNALKAARKNWIELHSGKRLISLIMEGVNSDMSLAKPLIKNIEGTRGMRINTRGEIWRKVEHVLNSLHNTIIKTRQQSDESPPDLLDKQSLDKNCRPNFYGERILWEVPVQLCIGDFLYPGDCVIDAGANIGALSIAMSRIVGPTGQIHAFEANPALLPRLTEDFYANEADNVVVVSKALWSESGRLLPFYLDDTYYAAASSLTYKPDFKEIVVETMTLDDYCTAQQVIPKLIKLDVEGAEYDVLAGANRIIKQYSPVIVFEYCAQRDDDIQDAAELLSSLSYTLYDTNRYQKVDREFYLKNFERPQLANILAIPPRTIEQSRYLTLQILPVEEVKYDIGILKTEPISLAEPGRYIVQVDFDAPDSAVAILRVLSSQHKTLAYYEASISELRDHSCSNMVFELDLPADIVCEFIPRSPEFDKLREFGLRLVKVFRVSFDKNSG